MGDGTDDFPGRSAVRSAQLSRLAFGYGMIQDASIFLNTKQ